VFFTRLIYLLLFLAPQVSSTSTCASAFRPTRPPGAPRGVALTAAFIVFNSMAGRGEACAVRRQHVGVGRIPFTGRGSRAAVGMDLLRLVTVYLLVKGVVWGSGELGAVTLPCKAGTAPREGSLPVRPCSLVAASSPARPMLTPVQASRCQPTRLERLIAFLR